MKQDIKQRWVEALRSGNYEQGQGVLRTEDDTYCCLGVLCNLVDPENWTLRASYYVYGKAGGLRQNVSFLPDEVRVEVGITADEQAELVQMNDTQNAPFEDIARWIEENL